MRDSQTYRCKKRGQDKKVIQCHFISNTHWDREWRFSMQRTRHMLVHMMDMLLDILEKYPEYSSFHLDSQTVPIHDYLEIRPEKKQTIKDMVKKKGYSLGHGSAFLMNTAYLVSRSYATYY